MDSPLHSVELSSPSASPYSPSPSSSPTSPHHHQQQQQYHEPPASTMRQRQVQPKVEAEPEEDNYNRFARRLKTLDVYPKTEDDIAIKTQSGGMVSLTSICLIVFLCFNEIWSFLSTQTTHSILVDTRTSNKLQINFDITFHALRCSETTFDVMDVSGEAQVAIAANIHRRRLTSEGVVIDAEHEYEDHAHDDEQDQQPNPNMNPMLIALGLAPAPVIGPDHHTDRKGEGCNVRGTLLVNRVAGNVHVALGGVHSHADPHPDHGKDGHTTAKHHTGHEHTNHHPQQQHIHQFMIQDMATYNCSHRINHFSFGQMFPGVVNPLDGESQIIPAGKNGVPGGSAHMQYFIKVVPTLYESAFGTLTDTNQYSVTKFIQPITLQDAITGGGGQKIPGVFFVYELSPFMVKVSEVRERFISFITSLFAIVGGVFTIAGIIDSILFHSQRFVKITSPK